MGTRWFFVAAQVCEPSGEQHDLFDCLPNYCRNLDNHLNVAVNFFDLGAAPRCRRGPMSKGCRGRGPALRPRLGRSAQGPVVGLGPERPRQQTSDGPIQVGLPREHGMHRIGDGQIHAQAGPHGHQGGGGMHALGH